MSQHITAPKVYYLIFGTLLVLTGLTVLTAQSDLGSWNGLHTPIALGIAVAKAVLVALFFMHVIASTRLTVVVIVASVFMLTLLLVLTWLDYWSRNWVM
jgi:cytochrome c oxidase subunit IV